MTPSADRLNILVLYDDRSTFIKTVAEHLGSFKKYSSHNVFYLPATGDFPDFGLGGLPQSWNLNSFDAVVQHYAVRVGVEGHFNPLLAQALARYQGPKILFIQDEYDATEATRRCMERIGYDIIYTCTPDNQREKVYPRARFPKTRFIRTLTGYVPEEAGIENFSLPMAERNIRIGYRGRALPHRYGNLAREKYTIGVEVRKRAKQKGIATDIEVEDAKRIYGGDWYRFIGSVRATLGTESGSNIFDFDGSLLKLSRQRSNPAYEDFHARYLAPHEDYVMMNQISPRVFEAIRLRTALILFEGEYSGIVEPHEHYMPLKKDFSNLDKIFGHLEDIPFLEAITERAYRDIACSGKYSYKSFIESFEAAIAPLLAASPRAKISVVPDPLHPLSVLLGTEFLTEQNGREKTLTTYYDMVSKTNPTPKRPDVWGTDWWRPMPVPAMLYSLAGPFWRILPQPTQKVVKKLLFKTVFRA